MMQNNNKVTVVLIMKNDTYGGGEVIKNEIQITVCSISRVEYVP